MVALRFLYLVKAPVLVEVPAALECAQLNDGLGVLKAPPGTGNVHPVCDQVRASTHDHPAGDQQAGDQIVVVLYEVGMVEEVVGTGVDRFSLLGVQLSVGRAAANAPSYQDASPQRRRRIRSLTGSAFGTSLNCSRRET